MCNIYFRSCIDKRKNRKLENREMTTMDDSIQI